MLSAFQKVNVLKSEHFQLKDKLTLLSVNSLGFSKSKSEIWKLQTLLLKKSSGNHRWAVN
jgi:hypothetical protein